MAPRSVSLLNVLVIAELRITTEVRIACCRAMLCRAKVNPQRVLAPIA